MLSGDLRNLVAPKVDVDQLENTNVMSPKSMNR
jgi:hypothetical protein